MPLTALEPRWWGDASAPLPDCRVRVLGVTFLCPHCRTVRLGIAFANPWDGGPPSPIVSTTMPKIIRDHIHKHRTFDVPPGCLWTRTGMTFETLSLVPSVDASKSGHWHGSVTNGVVQ